MIRKGYDRRCNSFALSKVQMRGYQVSWRSKISNKLALYEKTLREKSLLANVVLSTLKVYKDGVFILYHDLKKMRGFVNRDWREYTERKRIKGKYERNEISNRFWCLHRLFVVS